MISSSLAKDKWQGFWNSARIPNVPSVLCQTATGFVLAIFVHGLREGQLANLCLVSLASVCFYVAGNLLNDWHDRHFDRYYRPQRALPRGLFTPSFYLRLGLGLLLCGLALAAVCSVLVLIIGFGLVAMIGLYTAVHKQTVWSVIPMGLCRAALPLLGWLSAGYDLTWLAVVPALSVCCYVIGLSLSARGEANEQASWCGHAFLSLAGACAVALPWSLGLQWFWLGLVPFLSWLALCLSLWRKPVSNMVSKLLAGIPWLDGVAMLPVAMAAGMGAIGSVLGSGELSSSLRIAALLGYMMIPFVVLTSLGLQRLFQAT